MITGAPGDATDATYVKWLWFLGGVAATLLVALIANLFLSYLSWMSEVRRRGFDAYQEMYAAAGRAAQALVRFVANAMGYKTLLQLEANGKSAQDPSVAQSWERYRETYEAISNFRTSIDRCSLFLADHQRKRVKEISSNLWDALYDTGDDRSDDMQRAQSFYQCADEIGRMTRSNFLSFWGFLRVVFLGFRK